MNFLSWNSPLLCCTIKLFDKICFTYAFSITNFWRNIERTIHSNASSDWTPSLVMSFHVFFPLSYDWITYLLPPTLILWLSFPKLFHDGGPYYIKTSSYKKGTSVLKELISPATLIITLPTMTKPLSIVRFTRASLDSF